MMPASLYGDRKKDYELTTANGITMTAVQMKQPLLCFDCEQMFDSNGETHVLDAIAAKNRKAFPLAHRMRVAYARESDGSLSRFYGPDFNLDMDKFAYFGVSVVWRAAEAQWTMPDGTLTQQQNLGDFQENMRRYLRRETPLPSDMAVIVIVCSDAESRRRFYHPTGFVEAKCLNFMFLARGVLFRVMMGYQMTPEVRAGSCTTGLKRIWYGDGTKALERTLSPTLPTPHD